MAINFTYKVSTEENYVQKRPNTKSSRIDTLIGRDTEINGDISFTGGLRIDGTVNGTIYTQNDDSAVLTLSEQGKIKGEIKVPNLIINGSITGDVYSSYLLNSRS